MLSISDACDTIAAGTAAVTAGGSTAVGTAAGGTGGSPSGTGALPAGGADNAALSDGVVDLSVLRPLPLPGTPLPPVPVRPPPLPLSTSILERSNNTASLKHFSCSRRCCFRLFGMSRNVSHLTIVALLSTQVKL